MLITLFGMRRAAKMVAARLFPHPWQKSMRDAWACPLAFAGSLAEEHEFGPLGRGYLRADRVSPP
jgi:hypothetical protein